MDLGTHMDGLKILPSNTMFIYGTEKKKKSKMDMGYLRPQTPFDI